MRYCDLIVTVFSLLRWVGVWFGVMFESSRWMEKDYHSRSKFPEPYNESDTLP